LKTVTCSFTGHRPDKLPWGGNEEDARCAALKKRLAREIISAHTDGYRRFLCGMARGADLLFCEVALRVRDELLPDITVEAAIPCDAQADSWPEAERERYRADVAACNSVTYVSHAYTPGCMKKRNRYLVDQASRLIAVYTGVSSGTMQTVLFAMRDGLEIITIDPAAL